MHYLSTERWGKSLRRGPSPLHPTQPGAPWAKQMGPTIRARGLVWLLHHCPGPVFGFMLHCCHRKILNHFHRRLHIYFPFAPGPTNFVASPSRETGFPAQPLSLCGCPSRDPPPAPLRPDCSFDLRHGLVPGSTHNSRMMVSSTSRDYPNHSLL